MKEYSVNEIFYSLQGEGFYTGKPAVFVRFSACNLRCPFCDTDFSKATRLAASAILNSINACIHPSFDKGEILIVLTGGEPTLQVDENLLETLHAEFPVIAMETNGTREIPAGVDFVTCSPKSDFVPAETIIKDASEVKVVWDGKNSPKHWERDILAAHYYIQPCDTGDTEKNFALLQEAVNFIKGNPKWRLSLQTQKIIKVR